MIFSEFFHIQSMLEKISVDNNKLVFNYKDTSKGDNKESIGTSFGKGKLIPFMKSDSILDKKKVYSVYKSSGATDILKAIKSKNDIDMDSDDYKKFINRTAIYLSKVIQDEKVEVILSPKSSAKMVDDVLDAIKLRLPYIVDFKAVFEKISVDDIKNVSMIDDPRVTDKIRLSFETIKKKAIKDGYFAMVKVDPKFRHFVRGFFQDIDEKVVKTCENKKVALLDDIISSGTTIAEMMRMIGAAGASDVIGITVFKS